MSVLSQAKYYYDKFHVDNEWSDSAAITWMGKRYSPDKLIFFKRFFGCLTGEKFLNKATELYIQDSRNSIRSAARLYNNEHPGDVIKEDNAVAQFNYCSKKLNKIFDDKEMLDKVINSNNGINKKYIRQLNEFISIYGVKNTTNKEIILKLPAYSKMTEISEEEFVSLLKIIEPYTKETIKKVQHEINQRREAVGYLNYIMIPDLELTDEEKYRKNMVEAMLGHDGMTLNSFLILNSLDKNADETNEVMDDDAETDDSIQESFNKQVQEFVKSRESLEKITETKDTDNDVIDLDIGPKIEVKKSNSSTVRMTKVQF